MANIYLKVPTYVAQFYRGRVVPAPPLSEFQPVEFSPFQDEHMMMSSWLTLVSERNMEHTNCFSERMWKNILNGRKPQGGKTIINRDNQEWPSMDEINTLTGTVRNRKTDGFDYLCIAAPKVIVIGGQFKSVTSSFTMPFREANELARQLRKEFLRIFLRWICQEIFICDKRGIRCDPYDGRDIVMCIDHFFYHYQMCLGTNGADRDSMRRMAKRWLEDAMMLPESITDEDVLFFYKKEMERRGENISEIITNVKSHLKKT